MRIISKIAKAELRSLFYSPVAWVIILVFFIVSGVQFVDPLMDAARAQEVIRENNADWDGFQGPLTFRLFIDTIPAFLGYLYLFIPLLTMGVIGREVNSGSIKLLYSSAIRTRDIVLGKYLGLVLFNLILLSSVALLLFTGYLSVLHAELNWYLTILLGFFLLSSAYTAIGLFISCLANYQIVACIATFVVFFIMNKIGNLWQQHDFIRDLSYFLSLAGRTETMIRGLITSREVFYFVIIIALFLGLSVIKLKSTQESRSWKVSFTRYVIISILALTIGYFSSRPGYVGYYDVTRDKINTIDANTQKVLKELDGSPITVTLYTNLLGANAAFGLPAFRNTYVWKFWDNIVRFYPNINLRYEYYYDIKEGDSSFYHTFPNKTIHEIADQYAKLVQVNARDFKKPGEINKMVDLSREPLRLIMELQYKGHRAFLRTFESETWPSQPVIAASIRRLVRAHMPQLIYTTGHYERSPWRNGEREFGSHTNDKLNSKSLINLGFDIDTLSVFNNEIPTAAAALIVADPKSHLENIEQERIIRFLEDGGNALFYAEPGKQQMLNPVLSKLGVNLEAGILVKPYNNTDVDYFEGVMTKAGNYMAGERYMQIFQRTGKRGASAIFPGTSVLTYQEVNGFKIEPIVTVKSDEKAWVERGRFVADSAAPVFSINDGDVRSDEYVLGIKMSRIINGKEQRIVIVGDADFMSPRSVNGATISNGLYSWLVYNEYPVYTKEVIPLDVFLTIGKNTGKLIWSIYVYVLPGFLLLGGGILLIRRKRR